MANGFVTSSPAARHGDGTSSVYTSDWAHAQKFTTPADMGTVTEIGLWCSVDAGQTAVFKLGIFTHDAGNDCPEALVDNSDSGDLSQADSDATWDADKKKLFTYVTPPTLSPNTIYWIVFYTVGVYLNFDRLATGGSSMHINSSGSYPTPTEFHTHTDTAADIGMYVVYTPAAGGASDPILLWIG